MATNRPRTAPTPGRGTRRPRKHVRRLPPARKRSKEPRWPAFALPFIIAGAFWVGRTTAPEPPTPAAMPPPACEEDPGTLVSTSTAGLCPCPKPRKPKAPRPSKKAIAKKKSEAVVTPAFERPDPTKATAAYLKREIRRLALCAPEGGKRLRVHLEVTVTPGGAIDAVSIRNVEPIAQEVATCVKEQIGSFEPPPFDAIEPATFALTAVL